MSVRSARRAANEYSRVLTNVFELMLGCGLLKNDIQKIATDSLASAKGTRAGVGQDLSGTLATAALVLDAWHRDRRYLTPSAQPRAVPLLGPAPSVEALIRAEPGRHKAAALARRLQMQQLVVSYGKNLFKPAGNVALASALDPLAIQHVARTLSMLLETVRHNLTLAHASQKLIERIAEVPDLPVEHVQAFRKFTQTQGWILLRTANDWLEARRVRTTDRKKVVRAGIHLHAYVGNSRRTAVARKSSPVKP
jgi:hypothetical protein